MKSRTGSCFFVMLIVTYLCASTAALAVAAGADMGRSAKSAPATGAGKSWDSLVAAAKKEGKVSVYALWRPQNRDTLIEAFKAKYGIDVEFTPFSRGSDLMSKVQTEQRAGLYLADVFGAGPITFLTVMKPAGLLGAIESMLVLPEVTNGKNWSTGSVPYGDRDKTFVGMISTLQTSVFYNTNMIKKGEIADFHNLLRPQYKGKIIMNDPTVTGAGLSFLVHLAVNIWDHARTRDFFTQLLEAQQVVLQRDNRLHVEEVARGKFAIGIAPNTDNLANFLDVGAHLDVSHFQQGVRSSAGAGALAVPNRSSHPNAAKLFVNWLLSKEGQTVFSKGFGNPSLRRDVAVAGFNPIFLPQPGEKVFPDSEEFQSHNEEVLKMVQKVMATRK